jgi:hypothetical protein
MINPSFVKPLIQQQMKTLGSTSLFRLSPHSLSHNILPLGLNTLHYRIISQHSNAFMSLKRA